MRVPHLASSCTPEAEDKRRRDFHFEEGVGGNNTGTCECSVSEHLEDRAENNLEEQAITSELNY